MNIEVNILDVNSILKAQKELEEYRKQLKRKLNKLCERLAKIGMEKAKVIYETAEYTIPKDIRVTVEPREKGYVIKASGTDVLFVEFGTGYLHKNEWGDANGVPVGSYSDGVNGKGHWDNPKGWWYPGGGKERTFGNPPAMAMKYAQDEILLNLTKIAKEVLND